MAAPAALQSCPFTDTCTDALPAICATDMHSTTPPATELDTTDTVPPNRHSTDVPACTPAVITDSTLPPSANTADGATVSTDDTGVYLNMCSLVTSDTSTLECSESDTTATVPAGDSQVAAPDDATSAITTDDVPNRHPVTPATKPSPASVTTVPPDTEPVDGHTDETRAAPMYSTCTPLWLISPPPTDTSNTRMPAPRAGTTQLACVDDNTEAMLDDHVAPPTPQYTPSIWNPEPPISTSLPPITDTSDGSTELTFIALTTCTMAAPAALQSCPFTDTCTDALPAACATDMHSTTPPATELDTTDTVPPNRHSTDVPACTPTVITDSTLPPSANTADGLTASTEDTVVYLNMCSLVTS